MGKIMYRNVLLSKIHRANVTGGNIDYTGSITIDSKIMEAAGILEWERVQIVNVNNGVRFETYVIPGEYGKGEIILNGAAARLALPHDKVIIMTYGWLSDAELENHKPLIVHVNETNQIIK